MRLKERLNKSRLIERVRDSQQSGSVLTEATLIIPLMFFLIGFTVDAAIALTQHELLSFNVTAVTRDVSVEDNVSCNDYVNHAHTRLQNAIRSFRLPFHNSSIHSQIEQMQVPDPSSGGALTDVDKRIRVDIMAAPFCIMCFVTTNLFRGNHSSAFLLEERSCS
jgi:hypothetical protein